MELGQLEELYEGDEYVANVFSVIMNDDGSFDVTSPDVGELGIYLNDMHELDYKLTFALPAGRFPASAPGKSLILFVMQREHNSESVERSTK